MPLSLNETCYLRKTGNVNSEKLPGNGEKHDHQYLWRGASANFHTTPVNSCYGYYISMHKRHKGESDDRRMISVYSGGIIFHKTTGMTGSCLEPVAF